MSRGVNKVILVGHLGKDPEMRAMPSGAQVANFSVATTDSWKDKETGELKERTEWHRVACFGRLAEVCGEYLRKGKQVYIEGSLRTRKWQDKQGNDRYTTEINCNEMQMLGSKGEGGGGGGDRTEDHEKGDWREERPVRKAAAPEDFDDDIPFSLLISLPFLPLLVKFALCAGAVASATI